MNARWRKGAIFSATLVGGYLLTWVAVFSAFMGLDYRYVPQYFAASWLGGGELPAHHCGQRRSDIGCALLSGES